MAKKPMLTAAQIKNKVKQVQKVIEQQRRKNKLEHFVALTREEIEKKLKRANSPFITSQGWSYANPGESVLYQVGIFNPDPTPAHSLYAHVWVGSGHVDPVVGTFLLNIDTRFPRLTQPTGGLRLAAGAGDMLYFELKVPVDAEKTNYMGQTCLMRINYHGIGQYLDRATFPFEVNWL